MIRVARLLPLVTVLAWAITLALPILDSGNARGPTIVVSSLGGAPFDLSDANAAFVAAWVAVLVCAASVWLVRTLKWWSLATILVAVLLAAMLLMMIVDPPTLSWDGVDAQGRETGGYEIGKPVAGAVVWAVGLAALGAAGICGLIGHRRQQPNVPPTPSPT